MREKNQEAQEPPESEETNKHDFAEARPRVLDRDELTVVFSRSNVELDFRKSYLAS